MPLSSVNLVQVMAWCHQAASHYLSHCWPRYVLQYGVTTPQWVSQLPFIVVPQQNWRILPMDSWFETRMLPIWVFMSLKSDFKVEIYLFWGWWIYEYDAVIQDFTVCKTTTEHQPELRLRQNGHHFTDDIFNCIFLNENVWISIKISHNCFSWGFNLQYSNIGSDNGLAPTRRQAIICNNVGCFTYMRHSDSMI